MSACAFWIESTAWLRKEPGRRLNDNVLEGNCPWCGIDSGAVVDVMCAMAVSGINCPAVDLT